MSITDNKEKVMIRKAVAAFGPGIVQVGDDDYEITEATARKMRINFDDCVYNTLTQRACICGSIVAECLAEI